jgi:hypothetical protein
VARQNVIFIGNSVHIDSYDSADPLHDNPLDPNEIKANGDVASADGLVDVGNANINGKIKTGPGGSYSFGVNGWAGPIGWTGPGLYSPAWYQNDFRFVLADVKPPFNPVFTPSPTSTLISVPGPNGTNYWNLTSGDYYYGGTPPPSVLNNLNIVVSGNVRLWMTGDFKPNTSQEIFIGPNSSLKLYVGNTTGAVTSAEFGSVNTTTGSKAAVFQYFGLPNNTNVTWGGNQAFKGTIYAPNAGFTVGGSGSTIYDYQGACVARSVLLNGHFNFHYDEDLRMHGPLR